MAKGRRLFNFDQKPDPLSTEGRFEAARERHLRAIFAGDPAALEKFRSELSSAREAKREP